MCRGLVACANANAPHTNGAQFFFTFDRCDHLDRKNTIFGRITGESIYNAMSFGELEARCSYTPRCHANGVWTSCAMLLVLSLLQTRFQRLDSVQMTVQTGVKECRCRAQHQRT